MALIYTFSTNCPDGRYSTLVPSHTLPILTNLRSSSSVWGMLVNVSDPEPRNVNLGSHFLDGELDVSRFNLVWQASTCNYYVHVKIYILICRCTEWPWSNVLQLITGHQKHIPPHRPIL